MRADSIRYLKDAGFDFKPAESPDLWCHLESHFAGPRRIGPKFMPMPASSVAELIGRGENALLEALMAQHRKTGKLDSVAEVIDMSFVVGTDATASLADADRSRLLDLIDQPGTPQECIIHVLPAKADAIPGTCQVTVTGGLYADGHTAGFYTLRPGNCSRDLNAQGARIWLATPSEIATLAREMERRIEDIALVSRKECESMIVKARQILNQGFPKS